MPLVWITLIVLRISSGSHKVCSMEGLCIRLAKSTRFPGRLPVFQHFYPSTRFFYISTRFWNSDFQTKLYFY